HRSDVTGTYQCDDGGRYFVRQLGNVVWWLGMSNNDGNSFTNVFRGVLQPNNQINGEWAAFPKGADFLGGRLTLLVEADGSLERLSATGGFGGSRWTPG